MVMAWTPCAVTNVTVPHAIVFRDTAKTSSVKVVECEQTNTGSHAAHPGTHWGALHGRYGAPTATDGSDENPRGGKRVKHFSDFVYFDFGLGVP